MATKRKTIKDLNDIVETFEVKIKHLEEKVKKMEKLEEKIIDLEDYVKKLRRYPGQENKTSKRKMVQEKRKCKDIKCSECEMDFEEQWKFEKHLANEHGNEKSFNCKICDESFYTKWRLEQHTRSHNKPKKFCHYFNNFKKCPYKDLGCKFRRAQSEQCRFQDNCSNRLCQYRHK